MSYSHLPFLFEYQRLDLVKDQVSIRIRASKRGILVRSAKRGMNSFVTDLIKSLIPPFMMWESIGSNLSNVACNVCNDTFVLLSDCLDCFCVLCR